MKNTIRLLTVGFLFFLVYLLGTAISRVQAQSGPLDITIQSCAVFASDESHLDAAFHVVTKGYKTVPGQTKPVAQIEGVETPEKVKEFMDWYANGGREEMSAAGSACEIETMNKSGEMAQLRTGIYVAQERARNAEFFAGKLLQQCTGKMVK